MRTGWLMPSTPRSSLMVHGGGWRRGDKANPGVVKNKVAHYVPAGYLVVSVNYRSHLRWTRWPQAHDVAAALSFVQSAASAWVGIRVGSC